MSHGGTRAALALAAALLGVVPGTAGAGTLVESATLEHGGIVRWFDTWIPDPLPTRPMPLLLWLHGGTQSNDAFAVGAPSEFRALADAHGFLIVMPNGTSSTTGLSGTSGSFNWNDCRTDAGPAATVADDVGFLAALLDRVEASHAVDSRRVYAVGASNGGMMAYRLALELPQRFAAVAAVIANLPANSECPAAPAVPVSVLIMNGTADTFYMPHGGGQVAGNRGLVLSAAATRDFFLGLLGAGAPVHADFPDLDPQDGGTVGLDLHGGGASGTELAYFRVDGGAHNYPSIAHPLPPQVIAVVGPQNHDVEAAAEIWSFLARQALPVPVPALAPGPAALLAATIAIVAARWLCRAPPRWIGRATTRARQRAGSHQI